MNWRRGLFRLWIVGTVLFVIAVAFVSYGEIKAQFDATALQSWAEANDALLVPQFCDQARGVAGTDYSTQQERHPADPYAKPCWYAISKFRPLYPEYNNLSDEELSRKLYDYADPWFRHVPWATLETWAGIAFGIPLAVLVLGASLVWALSGFAAKRP